VPSQEIHRHVHPRDWLFLVAFVGLVASENRFLVNSVEGGVVTIKHARQVGGRLRSECSSDDLAVPILDRPQRFLWNHAGTRQAHWSDRQVTVLASDLPLRLDR